MLKFLTNVQSSASVRLTLLFGSHKVGTDALGNVYYTKKPRGGTKRERRLVLYNGVAEASSVPPEWHGWLHHQTDVIPPAHNPLRRVWQKPPLANMTGTKAAYLPDGHVLQGGARAAATGDYQAWTPDNEA